MYLLIYCFHLGVELVKRAMTAQPQIKKKMASLRFSVSKASETLNQSICISLLLTQCERIAAIGNAATKARLEIEKEV